MLPIAPVLFAFAIIVVLAVARWRYVLYKKHKALKASGSAFGRSAYSIVEHDVAERVCARGTKLNGLYCKYIRCVGI